MTRDEFAHQCRRDPLLFGRAFWPDVAFYDKQCEAIRSVCENKETYVVAGHQLGKDFLAGFVMLWYFLCHHPVRVVATSVKDDHLRVLFGELGRFVETARKDTPLGPLSAKEGGPLIMRHRDYGKLVHGMPCPLSYMRGMVSEKGEGLAGHHAPYALLVVDEASGCDDVVYERGSTWAKRILVIGNPYPANSNFFERAVKGGDILQETIQHGRHHT